MPIVRTGGNPVCTSLENKNPATAGVPVSPTEPPSFEPTLALKRAIALGSAILPLSSPVRPGERGDSLSGRVRLALPLAASELPPGPCRVALGKQLHSDTAQAAHDPNRPEAEVAGLKFGGPLSYGGTPGAGPTPAAGSVISRVFGCSRAGVSLSCLCRQSVSGKSDSLGHLSLSIMPS